MKAAKLREQTDEELRQMLAETRRDLVQLRLKRGKGDTTEQPLKLRTMRRDVARILTVMRQRGQ